MKVIVFGASGFIGSAVAKAFSRAGHITYGQSRSQDNARLFVEDEIIPIICDPLTAAGRGKWGKIALTADVLIDATATKGADKALTIVSHFKKIISSRPADAPKPTYIYTGGLWSWTKEGHGLDSWSDERQPRTDVNTNTIWRKDVEAPILTATEFNGVVMRPPMLYGRSGSFIKPFIFDPAYEAAKRGEVFETLVRDDTRWQTIHQDDLGEAYVKVAEIGHIARGQTFLPANPQTERLTDLLDAVVRVSGAKGWKAKEAKEPLEKAWVSTLHAHPSLLTALTGWRPKKLGLVDGIDVYWQAYLATGGH